jgi:hypothetical protein
VTSKTRLRNGAVRGLGQRFRCFGAVLPNPSRWRRDPEVALDLIFGPAMHRMAIGHRRIDAGRRRRQRGQSYAGTRQPTDRCAVDETVEDVTAVAWAGSVAVVPATRQRDLPADPALFRPSKLGWRVQLSLGSYS